jgi:hypothetical protein
VLDKNGITGTWSPVRYFPELYQKYYKATDGLQGTEVYGTHHGTIEEWSIGFSGPEFN